MHTTLLLAALSFLTCLFLLPVVSFLAVRQGWYDLPGDLKIHASPIPRLGGVAMMGGLLVGAEISPVVLRPSIAAMTVLAGIWLLGLVDDLKGTSALMRLVAHFVGGGALWFAGWRLQWLSNPYLDLVATALFFAFVINSMNLVDGMDGLALTITCAAAVGFIVLFARGPMNLGAGLSWTLLSVCAAMLIYNYPPARMFMGDSGSTLVGAILAFLCLEWVRIVPADHSSLVPLAFLGLPLGDAVAAVVRRLRGKGTPFAGDRRHFYDLLHQRGWAVKRILALSFFASSILVLAGLLCLEGVIDTHLIALIILILGGISSFLLGSLNPHGPPTGPQAATAVRDNI